MDGVRPSPGGILPRLRTHHVCMNLNASPDLDVIGNILIPPEISSPKSPMASRQTPAPMVQSEPRQRSNQLTHDQVRARAGQILIGFENADPSQLGRISMGAFEHVLAVYGGIDEHLIKVRTGGG